MNDGTSYQRNEETIRRNEPDCDPRYDRREEIMNFCCECGKQLEEETDYCEQCYIEIWGEQWK